MAQVGKPMWEYKAVEIRFLFHSFLSGFTAAPRGVYGKLWDLCWEGFGEESNSLITI